jgi:enoyl-CoA hydratase/carnithine racemase
MSDWVRVDVSGTVATVTLDRPEQRNALSVPMLRRLADAFGDLAIESGVRAVVVAGAGRDFCAGADFAELLQARSGGPDAALDFDRPFRDALSAIADHPVPVVARVQGRALGGGCQLVLACDLAVAERDATFGIPSARLGVVIPLDSVERLVLAAGPRRAAELLYTGRTISGVEAEAWGLVAATAAGGELDATLDALVHRVTEAAPLSVRASKAGIRSVLEHLSLGHAAPGRTADFEMMAADALASDDLAEGIAAFRERRDPEFKGS